MLLTEGCQQPSAAGLDRSRMALQAPGNQKGTPVMPSAKRRYSPIVELRQYDLHPGTRDTLIDIFDRHFIEGQEAVGMSVIGQFRDLDNPDSLVWLRGFPDMETRRNGLEAFYTGPVWMAGRDAANATMMRFDNVLLLHPAWPEAAFALDVADRPGPEEHDRPSGVIGINLLDVRGDADEFAAWHREHMLPLAREAGAEVVGVFATETAENDFPALPVRTDRRVVAVFSRFPDAAALERTRAALAASPRWAEASKAAASQLAGPPKSLRLAPTARSLLR